MSIQKRHGNLISKKKKGENYYLIKNMINRYTYVHVHSKKCITLFQMFLRSYAERLIHDVT